MSGTHTRAHIEQWLIEHLAVAQQIQPEEIDPREPFASYGLESRAAVNLVGELEAWLGRTLDPTLTWDYPSIELLAAYLSQAE